MISETTPSHRYELKSYKLRQKLPVLLMISDLQDSSEFEVGTETALRDEDFMRQLRGKDIFMIADVYATDKVRAAFYEKKQLKKDPPPSESE